MRNLLNLTKSAKYVTWLAAEVILALSLISCERRPLEDVANTHYVRVYINEEIKNITTGYYNPALPRPEYKRPEIIRAVLYNPDSGKMVSDRYLRRQGDDALGHYYDGYIIAPPGDYVLMAYSIGTESTIVGNEGYVGDAFVHTNTINTKLKSALSSKAAETELPIRYDPDHIWKADCGQVNIPLTSRIDTLRNENNEPYFFGESLVLSYFIQIKIRNAQWISSSVALLSGMAGSKWMYTGEMNEKDETEVYFEMYNVEDTKASEDNVYTQFATFGTFGKLPKEPSELTMTFDFITTYGAKYGIKLDITDIFKTPEAIDHQWLLIDKIITIPDPPVGPNKPGGIDPDVGDWEDIGSDIEI